MFLRTKWKRQAAVGVDLLQEASNLAAVQNLIRTNPYWAQYMANPFFAQRLLPLGGAGNLLAGAFTGNFPSNPLQMNNLRRNFDENPGASSPNNSRKESETPPSSTNEEKEEILNEREQQNIFLNNLKLSKKSNEKNEESKEEEFLEKNIKNFL